jgi:CubicO group peptidase (beta-lactamase class C family)
MEVPVSKLCKRLISLSFLGLMLVLGRAASFSAQAAAQVPATDPAGLAGQIDKLLSDVYKPGQPGAAVLVKKQGKVILRKGYGLANLELSVPVEPDMIFRLGSITKQFTAVAVLMLAEEEKLSLQDEITKFLPDYPNQGKKITVEHLLTHTSGIKSYTDLPEWLPLQRKDMTVAEIIDLSKDKPMEFSPGERWKYCNSGYILLGAIIEKVSGQTYADFLQSRIFDPLGLKSTCYDSTSRIIPRRASGYAKGNAGLENAPYLSMSQPYAAGSLASSVDDLATWTESLLVGKLIKRETLERAFTPFKLKDGLETGYGYGWEISRYEGHRLIEHGGGIHGFLSYALFFPEDQVFVAVLTNSTIEGLQPEPQAFRVGCMALGIPYKEPVPISLSEKDLEPLTGVYVNPQGEELYITCQENKLFSQRTGGGKFELLPTSAAEFFLSIDSPTRVQFLTDGKGAVTGLRVVGRSGPGRSYAKTDKPLPEGRTEIKLDPALYDQYVGEYELAPGFLVVITKEDGKLMGQATGQPKVELYPEAETKFFLKVVDGQVEFVKDEDGQVTGLILIQGGQKLPGRKVK